MLRITEDEYAALIKRQEALKKPSKYNNKKVMVDGYTFDSKKEAARYTQLRIMERAGVIHCLRRQVPIELAPSVVLDGRKKPALRFVCDFVYFKCDDLTQTWEDVKSPATKSLPVYRIKKHLMKSVHNIDVVEVLI